MGEGRTIQVTEAAMQNILDLLDEARDVLRMVVSDDRTQEAGLWQGKMIPRTMQHLETGIKELSECANLPESQARAMLRRLLVECTADGAPQADLWDSAFMDEVRAFLGDKHA